MRLQYHKFLEQLEQLELAPLKAITQQLEVHLPNNERYEANTYLDKDKLLYYTKDILKHRTNHYSFLVSFNSGYLSLDGIEVKDRFLVALEKEKQKKEKERELFYKHKAIIQSSVATAPFFRRLRYLFNSNTCLTCR